MKTKDVKNWSLAVKITYQVVWVVNNSAKISPLNVIELVHLLDRMLGHLRGHGRKLLSRGQPKDRNLLYQLATFGLAWENWPTGQELRENAPNGPDIDRVGVVTAG